MNKVLLYGVVAMSLCVSCGTLPKMVPLDQDISSGQLDWLATAKPDGQRTDINGITRDVYERVNPWALLYLKYEINKIEVERHRDERGVIHARSYSGFPLLLPWLGYARLDITEYSPAGDRQFTFQEKKFCCTKCCTSFKASKKKNVCEFC